MWGTNVVLLSFMRLSSLFYYIFSYWIFWTITFHQSTGIRLEFVSEVFVRFYFVFFFWFSTAFRCGWLNYQADDWSFDWLVIDFGLRRRIFLCLQIVGCPPVIRLRFVSRQFRWPTNHDGRRGRGRRRGCASVGGWSPNRWTAPRQRDEEWSACGEHSEAQRCSMKYQPMRPQSSEAAVPEHTPSKLCRCTFLLFFLLLFPLPAHSKKKNKMRGKITVADRMSLE